METNSDSTTDGSPSDMDRDPLLAEGTVVGDYRIHHHLGSGTYGDVYAAEHTVLGRHVALKLLQRRLSASPEVVARFVAEARAVGRIRHRNLVDVLAFGTFEGDRHFYAMELLEGLTLGELLDRETRLDPERALPLLEGIAAGLDASHATGVVHRDLKPDNVFLVREPDGSLTPKLLDFGIAKLVDEDIGVKTATGVAMGTPRYMAPEQCRGKTIDHRADIYALGALTHEMLTGAPVFRGDTPVALMLKHTVDPPPRMSSVRPEIPPGLDAPVLAMLAKRPAERPATAGEAIAAIAAAARSKPAARTLPLGSMVSMRARDSAPATLVDRPPAAVTPMGTVLLDPPKLAPVDAHAATTLDRPIARTKVSRGAAPPPDPEAPPSLAESMPAPPMRSSGPVVAILAALVLGIVALTAFLALRPDSAARSQATASTASALAAPAEPPAPVTDAPAPAAASAKAPSTSVAPTRTAPAAKAATKATAKPGTGTLAPASLPRPAPPPSTGKRRDIGF